MPTGWKVEVSPPGPETRKLVYLVQARDAQAAIAAIRRLPNLEGAHIAISDDPPNDELVWLRFEEGEFVRIK